MYKLKFNQQIAASVSKPIGVNDLLKRLKALAEELQSLDQENVERSSLTKVATQLASSNILSHKNKGVTAYASCCIADLLRLCAPDAPFSQAQLRGIFECFLKQLKGLGDIESTYYQQYYYLIESLATVESIVLLGDIEKSDVLVLELFRSFFDTTLGNQKRQNVEENMVSIMSQLIDELPQLPGEVLNTLLAQLMRGDQKNSNGLTRESSANGMAKAVFKTCADRLQRNVCQYFTDIIFEANQAVKDSEHSETDDQQLRVAHSLVLELFICAPSTLQNVIPQLESELNIENVLCRILATQTLSAMLGSPNGPLLLQQYSSTYKAWTSRRNDKNVAIRAKWVEGIGQILGRPDGAIRLVDVEQLCIDGLITRLVDPDDRVRSVACQVIENLSYSTVKSVLTTGVLKTYSDRCRDRKSSAQEAAFRHIGKLFSWAYEDIARGDRQAIEKFSPLVNYILHCLYVNDMGINTLLEKTLYQDILGCDELDDNIRARRALHVLNIADERGRRALLAIVGQLQKTSALYLSQFLKCCDKYNGGIMQDHAAMISARLAECSKLLSQRFSDPIAAETDLMTFAKHNDRRSYKLIGECVSPVSDFKTVRKMMKECHKRASQISPQTGTTIHTILIRSSFQFFNRSIVSPISIMGREMGGHFATLSELILHEISVVHPLVYKAHIEPMTTELVKDPLSVSLNTMKALAHFARIYSTDMPEGDDFCQAMVTIMKHGSPQQAKQAVTIACSMPRSSAVVKEVVTEMSRNLSYGTDQFLAHLSVISQVSLVNPELIEDSANEVVAFCAKELLSKNRLKKSDNDTDEWLEDDFLHEECQAKCYAVRILGNRLRAYHAAETAIEIARPVMKALRAIILNMGELSQQDETPLYMRSRLRLEASRMILKLSSFSVYEQLITPDDFIQVALFAQDLEFNVRKAFLLYLQKSLTKHKLSPRWHVIMFLAAHDPEDEIRLEIKRRLSLLATQHTHHPDFTANDRNDDDLTNFSVYFSFYFDAVASADNLVLIYHYCQRVKQVADALSQDPENETNIYLLSDIAQVVIAAKAEQHNWPLLAYPKRLKLPTDLYKAQASNSDANTNQIHSFLTDEQRESIRARVLRHTRAARPLRSKTIDDDTKMTPRKRSNSIKPKKVKKSRTDHDFGTPVSERRSSARPKKVVVYANSATSDSEDSDIDPSDSDTGE
ncbi:unnamed protein product [Taphrina deformans PYCC 5710]|uniref:Uncharacterized protein n=1 Tax=Taphrina deformans (strain PYCC 5710 / ATCC 11124 / CBS 356.35 / IMI 108563 / JCM 9778 / NBRC 8474) TaxID=1097556 RepID=R4XNR5_TAPDE|nr:unnamed protein product [Taphrina deformans PYCC 5710]|eukprot:CCG84904.1 unnamed protein product [Taphrina deformans PYCC 5710]